MTLSHSKEKAKILNGGLEALLYLTPLILGPQFLSPVSLPHIVQAHSCFRVCISYLLFCYKLPKGAVKTIDIYYLTVFLWVKDPGVLSWVVLAQGLSKD